VQPFPPLSPLPPQVRAYAPDFARQFGLIMAALAALVASRFLRQARLVPLIIPLWNRITRAARRLERLMARIAAGKLPQPGAPTSASPGAPTSASPRAAAAAATPDAPAKAPRRGGPHSNVLPRGIFWLIGVLGYEAAGLASQLEALLAEAAAVELLAAVPAVGRITRPMKRLLAIGARQPRAARPKPAPKAKAKEPPEFIPPGRFLFHSHGYSWYEVPTPPFKTA